MKYCSRCGHHLPYSPFPKQCGKCKMTFYSNPLPVVNVIVSMPSGKIVLGKRRVDPGVGRYALPGGYMKTGETWQQTAYRETLEETGLKIDDIRFLSIKNGVNRDRVVIYCHAVVKDNRAFAKTTSEMCEFTYVTAPVELAFRSQTDALREFFYPGHNRLMDQVDMVADNAMTKLQKQQLFTNSFTPREHSLIQNSIVYSRSDPAGLPGHNLIIIVAKMMNLITKLINTSFDS